MFQRGRNPPLVTAITPFLSNHPYIRALCLSRWRGGPHLFLDRRFGRLAHALSPSSCFIRVSNYGKMHGTIGGKLEGGFDSRGRLTVLRGGRVSRKFRVYRLKFNNDKKRDEEKFLRIKKKKISLIESNEWNLPPPPSLFFRISFRIFHTCRKLTLSHSNGIAFSKQEGTSFSFYRRHGLRENFSSSREEVS